MTTYVCERQDDDRKCKQLATVFACGQHLCTAHAPAGDASCTHSLVGTDRCSYCGAVVAL